MPYTKAKDQGSVVMDEKELLPRHQGGEWGRGTPQMAACAVGRPIFQQPKC